MKPSKAILIGEDSQEVRGYLEMATRCMGYEAVLAEDGEEVLTFLKQRNDFRAILLDVMMPRKDGIETLREIRSSGCSVPIIMVSDASATFNVVHAMKMGANDFVAKPVAHEELRNAIHNALLDHSPAEIEPQVRLTDTSGSVFFGNSRRMSEIRMILKDVASSDAPILIRGETGCSLECPIVALNEGRD